MARKFGARLSTNLVPGESRAECHSSLSKRVKVRSASNTSGGAPVISDEKTIKSITFLAGPVGMELEPSEKVGYAARVVRFVDGGPKNNQGQARKSGEIFPGDFVVKAQAANEIGTTYDGIIRVLKMSHAVRELFYVSAWKIAQDTQVPHKATVQESTEKENTILVGQAESKGSTNSSSSSTLECLKLPPQPIASRFAVEVAPHSAGLQRPILGPPRPPTTEEIIPKGSNQKLPQSMVTSDLMSKHKVTASQSNSRSHQMQTTECLEVPVDKLTQEWQDRVDRLVRENLCIRQRFEDKLQSVRQEHERTEKELKDYYSSMCLSKEARIEELERMTEDLRQQLSVFENGDDHLCHPREVQADSKSYSGLQALIKENDDKCMEINQKEQCAEMADDDSSTQLDVQAFAVTLDEAQEHNVFSLNPSSQSKENGRSDHDPREVRYVSQQIIFNLQHRLVVFELKEREWQSQKLEFKDALNQCQTSIAELQKANESLACQTSTSNAAHEQVPEKWFEIPNDKNMLLSELQDMTLCLQESAAWSDTLNFSFLKALERLTTLQAENTALATDLAKAHRATSDANLRLHETENKIDLLESEKDSLSREQQMCWNMLQLRDLYKANAIIVSLKRSLAKERKDRRSEKECLLLKMAKMSKFSGECQNHSTDLRRQLNEMREAFTSQQEETMLVARHEREILKRFLSAHIYYLKLRRKQSVLPETAVSRDTAQNCSIGIPNIVEGIDEGAKVDDDIEKRSSVTLNCRAPIYSTTNPLSWKCNSQTASLLLSEDVLARTTSPAMAMAFMKWHSFAAATLSRREKCERSCAVNHELMAARRILVDLKTRIKKTDDRNM